MKHPARVLAVLLCAAALLAVSWAVPHYLMNTGVQAVLPLPAAPTPTPDPQAQAAAALESLRTAGAPDTLTADFLYACEQQSPGLCSALAAAAESGGYTEELFWQVSGKTYLYYRALYDQPLADNIHDTGLTSGPVTLAFTGDVNFADDWYNMLHYAKTSGIDDCFGESLLAEMRAADVLLCNNEFSFSDRGSPMPGKQFTFRAKTDNVAMWQQLGVDIVGLANNHCFDYGEDAFLDTLSTLRDAGIPYVGAGADLEEAMQPQFFLAGGMKIGYVACTRAEKYILTPAAEEDSSGVLRCYDPQLAVQAIEAAREQCDYLVVYVHWGDRRVHRAGVRPD